MNSISNRVLIITLFLCALSVIASSHLGEMHGQEKVAIPEGVGEELPGRSVVEDSQTDASTPPILYGNQTPFGQIPETLELGSSTKTSAATETQRQTVKRPSMDMLDLTSPPESTLPERSSDPGPLDFFPSSPNGVSSVPGTVFPSVGQPMPNSSSPINTLPGRVLETVPVTALNIAPTNGCAVCGSKTCTICCQPKCITKQIWIPQYHTVWSSIFETRYRTKIKEEAYTIEQEVDHQVPRIIQETVMVPEPRIRTFQDSRDVEEQYPVEEPYSVMVRKPRQRMVPVEREETYRYPVEQEYTVMVPQEKIVTETKYRTIKEKEPRQVKYTVEVPREKKRIAVDYKTEKLALKKREPYTYTKKIPLVRKEWKYKNVTETVEVKEPVVVYSNGIRKITSQKPKVVSSPQTGQVDKLGYVEEGYKDYQQEIEQVATKGTLPFEYTVAVPTLKKTVVNYEVSEPFEEKVVISWETRKQVPREVTRQYTVKIPYIENIPRQYKVKVPIQVMTKGERTIPKQIPRTKYQTVKRDVGKWVTNVCTIPTYEIESDHCGCSTCCPKTRTVRKTVWQPKIVTSKVPYTVFETVKETVPYEYPELKYKIETRDRLEPVTRYRTEQREATFTVYDFKPEVATKTVSVRKFRQVPMTREITYQDFDEDKRESSINIVKYEDRTSRVEVSEQFQIPRAVPGNEPEVHKIYEGVITEEGEQEVVDSKIVMQTKLVDIVRRVPYEESIQYEEEVELTSYRDVTELVDVQMPVPRVETYTEMVPEIRTRIEYVDVEKRVPYVETKTVTEMVPAKKTRTIFKTDVRTVVEMKPEIYFESVKETFTRTVYKKKFRAVPVNRAEIYWVSVPKVLKKTIFQTVKRKVKRPALRRVPVRVPYQVEVRIPRRVCTMVEHTITIPVEECCEHCTWHLPGVAEATNAWLEYSGDQTSKMFWWMREE